jgi:hypothetical protein
MAWLHGFVAVGVGAGFLGCASQQQTAQALTVVGAAAVVVGASMASDEECYGAPGEGGGNAYCSPGYGKATRNAGTGLAAAGVGLAAAGYAMTPKGPDRTQSLSRAPVDPASPYRLIRRDPPPEEATVAPAGSSEGLAPSAAVPTAPEECAGEGAPAAGSASCKAPTAPAPPAATPDAPKQPERSEQLR